MGIKKTCIFFALLIGILFCSNAWGQVEEDDYFTPEDSATTENNPATHQSQPTAAGSSYNGKGNSRKINGFSIRDDQGTKKGILLYADEEVLVLWLKIDQPLDLNQLDGNVAIYKSTDVLRVQSHSRQYAVFIPALALPLGTLGLFARSEDPTVSDQEVQLCCVTMGCICGAGAGALLAVLFTGPHINKYVNKQPEKYLKALPKVRKNAVYQSHAPDQLKALLSRNGF